MRSLRNRFSRDAGTDSAAAVEAVREAGREVTAPDDLDAIVDRLGDARVVMLGEASHGTSEYYRLRARLTTELVREADADFVVVEGDWTACYEVNRYVKGHPGGPADLPDALDAFDRWPTWMWANWEAAELYEWLREHNEDRPEGERVGFYGLDVYGLRESMAAVVDYLEGVDPGAAAHARDAYRCFEPYGEAGREYAQAMRLVPESCEEEVIEVLADLFERGPSYDGEMREDRFAAEGSALVAKNAEAYYRAMVGGEEDSWNVRDRHMAETLERLLEYHGPDATAVVWAHNTHVGDARATDMVDRGRLNVGQLARERLGDVALVGFGSNEGRVVAAERWGADLDVMPVPVARAGSYEHVFHEAGRSDGEGKDWLLFADDLAEDSALADPRGHRAIGVVYDPAHEAGNYVPTALPERYDAFVHVDETTALHPVAVHEDREKVADLYPWGL